VVAFAVSRLWSQDEHITTGARVCGSCGSTIEPRDARTQLAAAFSSAGDVYPIRQAWTFAIPPVRAVQPANKER
jgi:hypothetical protein